MTLAARCRRLADVGFQKKLAFVVQGDIGSVGWGGRAEIW